MTKPNKRVVIGLTGLKGSGKGTVAKILQKKYGAQLFRFSDALRDILTRLGLDVSRENLQTLSLGLRKTFSEDILTRALVTAVKQVPDGLIVLDGIRRLDELEGLDELGDFHLVAVEASLDVRYKRSASRGENTGEDKMTREEFLHTENAQAEITIPAVMAKASIRIINDGTYEELLERIEQIMKTIQSHPALDAGSSPYEA